MTVPELVVLAMIVVAGSGEETVAIRARSRADYQGSDDRGGTRFAELMPT